MNIKKRLLVLNIIFAAAFLPSVAHACAWWNLPCNVTVAVNWAIGESSRIISAGWSKVAGIQNNAQSQASKIQTQSKVATDAELTAASAKAEKIRNDGEVTINNAIQAALNQAASRLPQEEPK